MSVISIRLPSELLHKVDLMAHTLHLPRAEYVRRAIEHMNEETLNLQRKKRLMKASLKVRKESMKINAEFSQFEEDIDD